MGDVRNILRRRFREEFPPTVVIPPTPVVPRFEFDSVARQVLVFRDRAEELEDAIEEFLSHPGGRKGYAAARAELAKFLPPALSVPSETPDA